MKSVEAEKKSPKKTKDIKASCVIQEDDTISEIEKHN